MDAIFRFLCYLKGIVGHGLVYMLNETYLLKLTVIRVDATQEKVTQLQCENEVVRHININPVYYGRTKHVKMDCYSVRKRLTSVEINTFDNESGKQLADIFGCKSVPLPGQGCLFHSFRTKTSKLSFMESPSGIKFFTPQPQESSYQLQSSPDFGSSRLKHNNRLSATRYLPPASVLVHRRLQFDSDFLTFDYLGMLHPSIVDFNFTRIVRLRLTGIQSKPRREAYVAPKPRRAHHPGASWPRRAWEKVDGATLVHGEKQPLPFSKSVSISLFFL
ncbi:hypothetical protein LXL04_002179 [Taraxacum kok-saghyz]